MNQVGQCASRLSNETSGSSVAVDVCVRSRVRLEVYYNYDNKAILNGLSAMNSDEEADEQIR